MTENSLIQVALYLLVLLLLIKPLGWYMAQIYQGKPCGLNTWCEPFEQLVYRICDIRPNQEMGWKGYLFAMLLFNLMGFFAVYVLQRLQAYLPLNPQHFANVTPELAFNTAASFITNTNWQAYSGESSLGYFTQMMALTTQNFLSAATGMCLLVAVIRGLVKNETTALGNFWVDLVRGILYILLPLALIFALLLSSQGVPQNFKPYQQINLVQPLTYTVITPDVNGQAKSSVRKDTTQLIPMGPVASQVAIKQLGSNGGGFFNTNSAHPFENPTPLTNFLEMLAILLIPAAITYMFGVMVNDKRQGWVILLVMLLLFVPLALMTITAEQHTPTTFSKLGVDVLPVKDLSAGGNMEGKETRFGIANSALWITATTASSNGSVNAMVNSFTPLGGLVPLWLMHIGEVIFGGVGSGLYAMLMLIIITVFVAGLMVGRTPEYLGKKIEPYEMKMACVAILVMPVIVLIFTAIAVVLPAGTASIRNPGVHGFTEILYAFTSMVNNNGSACAGLNSSTPFYNMLGGIAMLIGRYWIAIPALAIAGSLVRKKIVPVGSGTLPTHTLLFMFLLIGIILVVGALTFFPALALGPIIEELML